MEVRQLGRYIADLIALARPLAAAFAGAQVVVGAHLTGSITTSVSEATLLQEGVAITFIVAAVNGVNDIVDIEADAISRPHRPLPGGRVSRSVAWRLVGAESVAALALSIGVPAAAMVNPVLLFLGIFYSYRLKSTVLAGNFTAAFLAATPLVYGGWLGGVPRISSSTAAGLIFIYMFAFEVLKTIRDKDADQATGYRTVATQWGEGTTTAIYRGTLAIYTLLAAVPILLAHANSSYSALIWPGAVLPPLIAGWLLPVSRSPNAVRTALLVMTLAWFPGIAALAIGFHTVGA
ncbi:UbiA family prenyltransferase [Nocardia sp. CA-119907]|uniref:UbiA family prenyltransferase n=1 Tax=Nocardia sp. CA-119907 TaxID=3239973 RepID=UPI003D96206F